MYVFCPQLIFYFYAVITIEIQTFFWKFILLFILCGKKKVKYLISLYIICITFVYIYFVFHRSSPQAKRSDIEKKVCDYEPSVGKKEFADDKDKYV